MRALFLPPGPTSSPGETSSIVSTLLNLLNPIGPASAQEIEGEEENRGLVEESLDPTEQIRVERYEAVRNALKEIDPHNHALEGYSVHGYVPTEADIGPEFAAAYTAKFLEAKVNNFSFVVIPAVREGRDGSYSD